MGLIVGVLRKCLRFNFRWLAPLLGVYVCLAGGRAPLWRAFLGWLILEWGSSRAIKVSGLYRLGLVALAVTTWFPGSHESLGTQLSFLSVAAIFSAGRLARGPISFIVAPSAAVLTTAPLYNVNSISVQNKVNGTIIKIHTSKRFTKDVLAASINRGGWLNLTIAGALVDSINLVESKMQKPVVRVRTIQSVESAQISFLLKSKVDDFEIETDKNNISIFLRTAMAENADKIKEMRRRWMLDTIVIDAGHGGKDAGAIGRNGLQEKTVNLDIAKKLGKLVEANMGIKVIYTRDEDVFIPLWKRTKIANDSGGKVFISIHANSVPGSPNVRGFETFLLRPGKTKDAIEVAQRENEVVALEELFHKYEELSNDKLILYTMAQSSFMKESEFLAAEIQRELDKVLTSPNRGVKQAGFHVLIGASMPNVLIESGFLSNKNESKLLGQSRYRQKIAQAIFSALVNFKDKYENPLIGDN